MKKSIFPGIIIALLQTLPAGAEPIDSLHIAGSENLTNRYTVNLKDIRLQSAQSELGIRAARATNGRALGIQLLVTPGSIYALQGTDTVAIADGLEDGLAPHDYTLVRNSSMVQVYRDKVLFAKVQERLQPGEGGVTLFHANRIADNYTTEILPDKLAEPLEEENETAIGNMLPAECENLIDDPYCNRGFTREGLNATDRTFYTQQAIYTGWGPNALIDTAAYSGKYCIRMDGQAVYPDQGASLDVNLAFESNTPYYIRAMVKSEGYTGKLAMDHCNSYLRITDTGGEWKQIEGVLTPSQTSNLLYLNNADYSSNGTLWLDNLEVYKGLKSTGAVGTKTEIPYIMLQANTQWAPTRVTNVYMLGFTDNGTTYSRINTTKVHMKGGSRLKKTIKGSQLYALHFPGPLAGINVTGYYDGISYTEAELEYGVDYILQRYDYPRFSYVSSAKEQTAGNYLIQFVDNMDGADVTLTFGTHQPVSATDKPYYMVGNATGTDYMPAGRFYKFDETEQRFLLTQAQTIKPFEAYIATEATVPVSSITPNGIETSIQRVFGTNGTKISLSSCTNGIRAYAAAGTVLNIYSLKGNRVKQVTLQPGENLIPLQRGFYLAGTQKIIVR